MRKIAFVKIPDKIQKLMIYESKDGVYLFGYDCLQDTYCTWDQLYQSISDAEEYCSDSFKTDLGDWIEISEPCIECQHDFIRQTRLKGRDGNHLEWGQFQTLVKGSWTDTESFEKYNSFGSLTGNERLFISGLMSEFDSAKKQDKERAKKILLALDFDLESIDKII